MLDADAKVVTICAGVPPEDTPPSEFDARAGFTSAAEAVRTRREEDLAAARRLGHTAEHLDCLDAIYGDGPISVAVGDALVDKVGEGEKVVGPLGLRHPDHVEVALALRHYADLFGFDAWAYEDLPYAYVWPETLAPALERMRCGEVTITRLSPEGKREAVEEYRSQTGGCHMDAILAPERYHRLES